MTTGAIFTDTSYFQPHVNDQYPHQWVSFRVCDGTFRDPAWSANYGWAKSKPPSRLTGIIGYCVYRPGVDTFDVVKAQVGTPDRRLVIMIDVESWGGQIRGDHSDAITALAQRFADWLGDRRRVIVYANQGDFANIYPHRPDWVKLVVAGYSSQKPNFRNMVGWQYSDGGERWPVPAGFPRSSPPFGHCDHNVFPGLTATQAAAALGVSPQPAQFDLLEWIMSLPGAPKGLTYQQLITDIWEHKTRSPVDGKLYPMRQFITATHERVRAIQLRGRK